MGSASGQSSRRGAGVRSAGKVGALQCGAPEGRPTVPATGARCRTGPRTLRTGRGLGRPGDPSWPGGVSCPRGCLAGPRLRRAGHATGHQLGTGGGIGLGTRPPRAGGGGAGGAGRTRPGADPLRRAPGGLASGAGWPRGPGAANSVGPGVPRRCPGARPTPRPGASRTSGVGRRRHRRLGRGQRLHDRGGSRCRASARARRATAVTPDGRARGPAGHREPAAGRPAPRTRRRPAGAAGPAGAGGRPAGRAAHDDTPGGSTRRRAGTEPDAPEVAGDLTGGDQAQGRERAGGEQREDRGRHAGGVAGVRARRAPLARRAPRASCVVLLARRSPAVMRTPLYVSERT